MFFAYNNGISTTAENVDVIYEGGIPYLSKIENMQIVNGGQTTASIYYTSNERDVDLSKVFVPMKISVIREGNELEDIVPSISKYANSQTAIKDSDFSSNSKYHISLENWSRREWIPTENGGKAISKWYYERTRGQYLDERSRQITKKEQRWFDTEYPKKQKFNKTDLAKYEMCWGQRPHEASKGGEKNFVLFQKEIDSSIEITQQQYQHLIAKAILFHETNNIVASKKLGGYKANVVLYTISLLSYKSNKRLDLSEIWKNQGLSPELSFLIDKIIDIVWTHVNTPSKQGMNITEWCKKQECWTTLKDKFIDIAAISNQLISSSNSDGTGETQLTEMEINMIKEASCVKGDSWFALAKWAKVNNLLTPFDRKLSYNLGVLQSRNARLSPKQAKNALRILKDAKLNGFLVDD
jgi:hypothetical protein